MPTKAQNPTGDPLEAFAIDEQLGNALVALVAHGRTVVVNVSRSVAPVLRTRYSRGRVVLIDAPQPVRRSRLAQRGREDDPAINGRLVREVDTFSSADADIVINNSKSIVESARALADYLASLTTLAVPVRTA